MGKKDMKAWHQRSHANFMSTVHDERLSQALMKGDADRTFPGAPEDELAYFSNIEPLELNEQGKQSVRNWVRKELQVKTPQKLWENKHSIKLEIANAKKTFGLL